jgi:fructokinase
MIIVAGEALIDLVAEPDGRLVPRPGGGPFNTARTMGRLGADPVFLGRLSRDSFGQLLRKSLNGDGVALAVPELTTAPTTLAVVDLDAAGAARYRFYLAGTSASDLDHSMLSAALRQPMSALHAGSLALLMEPIATSIERLITTGLPPDTLVMIDPNCRPEAVSDQPAYRTRLSRILGRADVVKLSVEDLSYLWPGIPAAAAAAALLEQGPALVLVTDGPRPARALLPGRELSVEVPSVRVVDTIGAGDAFGGAFLAWWSGNQLTKFDLNRKSAVREALRAAAEVASFTCTRAGADPPWLAEVATKPGWRSGPRTRQQLPLP